MSSFCSTFFDSLLGKLLLFCEVVVFTEASLVGGPKDQKMQWQQLANRIGQPRFSTHSMLSIVYLGHKFGPTCWNAYLLGPHLFTIHSSPLPPSLSRTLDGAKPPKTW